MTIIDAETGEIVRRTPVIAAPGTPTTPELIAHQCRSLDVWSETCDSIPELKDAAAKLTAIGAYLARIDSEGRAKVAASHLRIERRIGELLGPAKRGGDRRSGQVDRDPLADALSKEQRRDFRKLADHPEVVEAVIDDSDDETPASRRRALDEINRTKHQPPAEPTPDEIRSRTAVLAAKELHKAHQFFAMFTPQQIHDLNDPDIARTVDLLVGIVHRWGDEFEATRPEGLTVINGGKQ